jgi:hypothetical protein
MATGRCPTAPCCWPWRPAIIALVACRVSPRFSARSPASRCWRACSASSYWKPAASGMAGPVVLLCFFMQTGAISCTSRTWLSRHWPWHRRVTTVASLLALAGLRRAAQGPHALAAARLVLQGLPLMLVLFVLFPRVQGPLWGLPADAYTGLHRPFRQHVAGRFRPLSESGAIAFRARFEGDPPPPAERYWRGPVLTELRRPHLAQGPLRSGEAARLSQPGHRLHLHAHPRSPQPSLAAGLDFPAATPGLRYSSDFQLLAQASRCITASASRSCPTHTRSAWTKATQFNCAQALCAAAGLQPAHPRPRPAPARRSKKPAA